MAQASQDYTWLLEKPNPIIQECHLFIFKSLGPLSLSQWKFADGLEVPTLFTGSFKWPAPSGAYLGALPLANSVT